MPANVRQLPTLTLRASVDRATADSGRRTVDVIWTTGARVLRHGWLNDRQCYEELSLNPEHVRLERLNNGAPVLDTHSGWSVRSQIGVVEPGSARLESGRGVATVRFSKRADVEPIYQDIRDDIIQNVSVGYRIYKLEKTDEVIDDKIPVLRAVDWEPFEISFVPAGADDGAGTRGHEPTETHACELIMSAVFDPADGIARQVNPRFIRWW